MLHFPPYLTMGPFMSVVSCITMFFKAHVNTATLINNSDGWERVKLWHGSFHWPLGLIQLPGWMDGYILVMHAPANSVIFPRGPLLGQVTVVAKILISAWALLAIIHRSITMTNEGRKPGLGENCAMKTNFIQQSNKYFWTSTRSQTLYCVLAIQW